MLQHNDIWRAIDLLAKEHGYSPSGLARRAGLDPTTFNKSKRVGPDGRPRWPSTESIAKVLEATGVSMARFVAYFDQMVQGTGDRRQLPLLRLSDIAGQSFDAAGRPNGGGWNEFALSAIGDPGAYALAVVGDSLAPTFRDGDILIVSPEAGLRRGDRVVVKLTNGTLLVKLLMRRNAKKLELSGLAPGEGDTAIANDDVAFVHRIVWVNL